MHSDEASEHYFEGRGHTSFYRASGPEDGSPIIFVHGWPELSLSWRHQLRSLGALGFRCIAPDLRGYGRSTVYTEHSDYALEKVAGDLLELADGLGYERAVWVGHDWGSPVVWSIASHHPERCHGVANLCVPYRTLDLGLDATLALVNRERYPESEYPAGQWDYMRYYEENFADATSAFEVNPYNTAKLLFRKGNPAGFGQPSGTSKTRHNGGWFGDEAEAPDLPRDDDVVSEEELTEFATYLEQNGFLGPDSYYMNHERNAEYGARALHDGVLDMPVLFLGAQYDYTCDTITSELGAPMRSHCTDLTEEVVYSGHWMAQERPRDVNSALVRWLADKLPSLWWTSPSPT
ncbi:MAG: alpha/beta hydrolase [Actinomycetota bacterium]|jgi:soluble epoxide hydrolase / lipid-phosphate phosphatase|nr:alpha/beta hydrolase [Actinomycetota bacterium]